MRDKRFISQKEILSLIFESSELTANIPNRAKKILCAYLTTDKTIRSIAREYKVSESTVKMVCLKEFRVLIQNIKDHLPKVKAREKLQIESFSNLTRYEKNLKELATKNIEEFPEALEIPLSYLGLEPRVLNSLLNGRINTLGDLLRSTKREVLMRRNMGPKALQQILDRLKEFNLWLKD